MFGIEPLENYSSAEKFGYFGRPKKMKLYDLWKGGDIVEQMEIDESLISQRLVLGDFGVLIKAGTSVPQKVQSPFSYCAPERLHGHDPTFATDMWSYMCIFRELQCGFCVIYGGGTFSFTTNMVDTLGPLPSDWDNSFDGGGPPDEFWYFQSRPCHPELALDENISY